MGTAHRHSTPSWKLRRRAGATTALFALLVGLIAPATASASISPSSNTLVIPVGGSATEHKTVGVPSPGLPPKADIEIAIDTTGSMDPSIAQAKADAIAIVTGVQADVPDTQFALVAFKDKIDGAGEYNVVQSMTLNATDVQTAISGLSAGGGGDLPEAQNLVFHNSYNPDTGGAIGWRAGTRKFVVMISDSEPHGAGTSGVAGCTDTSADPNSLDTSTELAGMKAAERTLIMIRQASTASATLACYQGLAAGAFSGGTAVDEGTALAATIVTEIENAFNTVNDIHLEFVSATPAPAGASWLTFSPAQGPVVAPIDLAFTVTATVPAATPTGTYTFDIRAVADGTDIGHQTLTIVVFGFAPGGGSFVIGDGNAAVNTNVTFWGAQWAKLNTLSGGGAPNAFKGFALKPSTPACGTDWTTDPGNSAPPPAGPLPSLMAVIVSSSISKSGSTISGDTAQVVVVSTNPGYQPNPGHAGTGKVVAVVCS
jgi:hypothetical protein